MHPGANTMVELIQRFLAGEINGPAFDECYRDAFFEYPELDKETYLPLERLAFVCSEYVDVPELREAGDVGDIELAEAARSALRELGVL
jgi:hypothetical protein